MDNLIIMTVMFFVGVLLNKTGKTKEEDYKIINVLLINIFLPSLILKYLHNVDFTINLFASASMPYVLTGIASAFFVFIGRWMKFSRETIGCLILTAAAGNTAFLGIPMIQAIVGNSAMPTAIAVDQLGSTPCILTFGVLIASLFSTSGQGFSLVATMKKIATFPPFIATAIAIALNSVSYPHELTGALEKLSACVAPLALLSIGLQLHFQGIKENFKPLMTGLFFRVFLSPLIVASFLWMTGHDLGDFEKALLIDSMMGTQITAMVIAQEYDLNKKLAVQMTCLSIPISIIIATLVFIIL